MIEEVLRDREVTRGLGDFLTYLDWQVYAILTFAYAVGVDFAAREGKGFTEMFSPEAFSFIAPERGDAGGLVHLHLLAGGLNGVAIEQGGRLWKHGLIKKWERYDPNGRAAWYVAKWPESSEYTTHR